MILEADGIKYDVIVIMVFVGMRTKYIFICAYCGKEAKKTREHIISSGILELFPECFLTFDTDRNVIYQDDPVVKDVCNDCNTRRISYIDAYAKAIIKKYFIKKYKKDDRLAFEYDLALIQKMCLKYAFNDLRSRKKNIDFFDDDIKNFILNETQKEPLRNITVLAGLAVNVSPMPDYTFGNLKLRWSDSPIFLSNSIVENINYDTGQVCMRDKMECESFPKCELTYVFRFNSLQVLILCWDKDISDELLIQNEVVLSVQYPYQILRSTGVATLTRCTSEVTYHIEKLIDVTWGQTLMDQISEMRGTFSESCQLYLSKLEKEWQAEENVLVNEHRK